MWPGGHVVDGGVAVQGDRAERVGETHVATDGEHAALGALVHQHGLGSGLLDGVDDGVGHRVECLVPGDALPLPRAAGP